MKNHCFFLPNSSLNKYYCHCGSFLESHQHDYTDHYEYYPTNYHKSYCSCGDYITEIHSYRINMHNTPCVCGGSLW